MRRHTSWRETVAPGAPEWNVVDRAQEGAHAASQNPATEEKEVDGEWFVPGYWAYVEQQAARMQQAPNPDQARVSPVHSPRSPSALSTHESEGSFLADDERSNPPSPTGSTIFSQDLEEGPVAGLVAATESHLENIRRLQGDIDLCHERVGLHAQHIREPHQTRENICASLYGVHDAHVEIKCYHEEILGFIGGIAENFDRLRDVGVHMRDLPPAIRDFNFEAVREGIEVDEERFNASLEQIRDVIHTSGSKEQSLSGRALNAFSYTLQHAATFALSGVSATAAACATVMASHMGGKEAQDPFRSPSSLLHTVDLSPVSPLDLSFQPGNLFMMTVQAHMEGPTKRASQRIAESLGTEEISDIHRRSNMALALTAGKDIVF